MTTHTLELAPGPVRSSWSPPLVATREDGEVLVVTINCESLSGRAAEEIASICLGYAEPEMGGHVQQAVSLELVREVTCAGLRALVQVADSLNATGGRLVVFGAPQEVRSVIRRTGLSGRLAVAHQGVKEAVRRAQGRCDPGRFRLGPLFGRQAA